MLTAIANGIAIGRQTGTESAIEVGDTVTETERTLRETAREDRVEGQRRTSGQLLHGWFLWHPVDYVFYI